MILRTSRDKSEKGATLVESAIVFGVLFLALFAIVEFGLAFKDWMSVSQATREGARAGATFGDDLSADIRVLDGVEQALVPHGLSMGDQVRVFRANTVNDVGAGIGPASTTYSYNPSFDCSDPMSMFPPGDCCNWSPCPEFGRSSYDIANFGWDPTSRDVDAPITDRIGVEISIDHAWVTNFVGSGSFTITSTTDYQIEPQLFKVGT